MPNWMSAKLKPYEASIFDSIGRLVRATEGVVNLGQGFPDFDGPDLIKEAAAKAMRDGHNQYAPMPGVPALTHAIRDAYRENAGISYDPLKEITVLAGATEAMYAAVTAICEPGDQFIVFAPIYDTYVPLVQMCGGTAVEIPLEPPTFRFDPDRLRAAFNDKTRGIIINTPHNPSGTVFNREEMELIRDLCIEHDVIAFTDEVYEYLLYDGCEHISMASLEGMRDRTVTISSTGKSFSMTGWKIGWVCAPPEATQAVRRLHQFIAFAIATPFQHGMAAGIRNRDQLIPPLRDDLAQKRDQICEGLADLGFGVNKPQGTYFVLTDISALTDMPDTEYVLDLIRREDVRVAAIPNSVFYMNQNQAPKNYIRFCFAKKTETLNQGMAQLKGLRG
ncbi:MAG: aminotransferase class I/II-fold pyridoxal phosphate-dependent enzyme [Acidobacteriota bacterium]|nr:aminotransferase class I/II-fold pyridoxal phosphate-dependent enzyme [Acidobacteriota bacterium]